MAGVILPLGESSSLIVSNLVHNPTSFLINNFNSRAKGTIFHDTWSTSEAGDKFCIATGSSTPSAPCTSRSPTPRPVHPPPAPRPRPKAVTWKDEIDAEEIDAKEDIPSTCLDNNYDVELKALNTDDGVHFFLAAKPSSDEKSSYKDMCPQLLTFTSIDEKKFTHRIHNSNEIDEISSSIFLGKTSLNEIMDAENSVEALKDSKYELTKNSCIHYAGRISRELQFEETHELANFLIENLLKDDGLINIAHNNVNAGGLRTISHLAGKGSLKAFVQDIVYSQLKIKEDGESEMIGKIYAILLHINVIRLLILYLSM